MRSATTARSSSSSQSRKADLRADDAVAEAVLTMALFERCDAIRIRDSVTSIILVSRAGSTARLAVGQLADQPVDYFGRTFSRAKYAAAPLRTSFSISNCRLRLRSLASSFFSALLNPEELSPASALSCRIQFCRHERLMPSSAATSPRALSLVRGQLDRSLPELGRIGLRHDERSPSARSSTVSLSTPVPVKRGQHQGVRATGSSSISSLIRF